MKVTMALLLVGLVSITAQAQNITGTIQGRVTDQSGAILPGVDITVRNLATNQSRRILTNDTGTYIVPLLPVGSYEVTAEFSGFKTEVRSNLELQVDQKLNVNFTLQVGEMSERLEVTESAPLVQSDTVTVGSVIDTQKIVELPLNGRQFSQLAILAPGTTTLPAGDAMGVVERGGFSVAGNRQSDNNFLIDGIDNNDISINIAGVKPSVDTIQEFKIQSGTYSSEFGRGGGAQINVITKSGSNEIHGTAYGFLRDSKLDARNFFDPSTKPYFTRKQFGGTLGGPIRKDKTFFFGGYEGLRLKKGNSRSAPVPTPEMASGDLSSLLTAPNILSNTQTYTVIDPLTGQAFQGNIIPPNRLNRVGVNIVKLFPQPNSTKAGQNFTAAPFDTNKWNQYIGRVDHRYSDNDSLFGRFNYDNLDDLIAYDPFNPTNLPGFGRKNPVTAINTGIVETHVFSAALINEFRVGYNYLRENKAQQNQGFDATQQVLGISGTATDPRYTGYPRIDVTGFGTIGEPTNEPQDRRNHTFQIYDGMSWIHGNHTWKFGTDLRRVLNNFNFNSTVRGQFQFTGTYSHVGIGDALLGYPAVVSINRGDTQRYFRANSVNAFVQHDWKYSRRLTLNMGLRYEVNTPPVEKYNKISNFNPATGQIELAGQTMPRGIFNTDYNGVAPRLGLTYNLTSDGKTIMRAGYGVYFNQQVWSSVLVGSSTSVPFVTATTYNNTPVTPTITMDNPFPGTGLGRPSLYSQDRNYRTGYMQQWSLGVQRELPKNMVVELSYLGNKATKLDISRPINQPRPGPTARPFPQYANLSQTQSSGNSNYNGLLTRLEKRFSEGLTFMANYTFSKAIADQTSPDMLNNRLGRGPANIDNRHRFVTNFLYVLPAPRLTGPAGVLVTGWQMSGILTLRSGQALTPTLSSDASHTLAFNDRPDLIGNWKLSNPTPSAWFNKSALATPAPFTFGNAGAGILVGPPLKQLDFSLMKMTNITENKKLEFRSEFFNITNHPNFFNPVTTFDSAAFGRVNSALDGRQIQFGLKVIF